MTILELLKTKNIDELISYFMQFNDYIETPWDTWFDHEYCSHCQPEMVHSVEHERKIPVGYCELYGKCKFLQNLGKTPDSRQVIKMWLESEVT